MSEPRATYDVGDRLPDLTAEEVRAVTQWARRVKAQKRPILLRRCPESGELIAEPMGQTERP